MAGGSSETEPTTPFEKGPSPPTLREQMRSAFRMYYHGKVAAHSTVSRDGNCTNRWRPNAARSWVAWSLSGMPQGNGRKVRRPPRLALGTQRPARVRPMVGKRGTVAPGLEGAFSGRVPRTGSLRCRRREAHRGRAVAGRLGHRAPTFRHELGRNAQPRGVLSAHDLDSGRCPIHQEPHDFRSASQPRTPVRGRPQVLRSASAVANQPPRAP